LIWSYKTGDDIYSSPAVANGRVFVVSSEGTIYCLKEKNGKLIWSYKAEGSAEFSSSPAVANGKVFVSLYSFGKDVYCLDENTGKLIWSYETGDWMRSSPAVADGKVFVYNCCLDENTGKLIWSYETGDWWHSSPAVANGRVFVGNCSLDENNGELIWSFELEDGVQSLLAMTESSNFTPPILTPIPIVYPTVPDWSSPAVADGKVFISCSGSIYCFGSKEMEKVLPVITSVQWVIDSAKSVGASTTEAEEQLQRANIALNEGKYEDAGNYASQAKESAEKSRNTRLIQYGVAISLILVSISFAGIKIRRREYEKKIKEYRDRYEQLKKEGYKPDDDLEGILK